MGDREAEPGVYEERIWPPDPAGYGKAARRGGRYRAFVPATISERSFEFDNEVGSSLHAALRHFGRQRHRRRRNGSDPFHVAFAYNVLVLCSQLFQFVERLRVRTRSAK